MVPQPQQAPQAQQPPRVVVANAKGGVGKTTVAANLIGALADRGLSVLGVDADPQGNLTEAMGHLDAYEADPPTLFDVLLDVDSRDEIETIRCAGQEADLIPSSIDMLGSSVELVAAHMLGMLHNDPEFPAEATDINTATELIQLMTSLVTPATAGEHPHGYGLLDDVLGRVDDDYDIVVIDAPPGHNPLFKNALFAAPHLIVPATAEASSKGAVDRLFDEIAAFEEETDVTIREQFAVVNRIRMSTNAANQMTTFLEQIFDDVPVFKIPERVALSYAYDEGESIFEYDPSADVIGTFGQSADHLIDSLAITEEVAQ